MKTLSFARALRKKRGNDRQNGRHEQPKLMVVQRATVLLTNFGEVVQERLVLVVPFETNRWSMVKRPRQATTEKSPRKSIGLMTAASQKNE